MSDRVRGSARPGAYERLILSGWCSLRPKGWRLTSFTGSSAGGLIEYDAPVDEYWLTVRSQWQVSADRS
ncbi:hypothetical protein DIJ64_09915 [Mycobacterium leprae]|uniref:Uncharacterized protein n=1 Tax=Mycobacterium leprae TaxID=1769 RepID=A0AAD0KVY7_MYCLR|nr:hypothetical protein DIJ64_09915 [Mycobacterium leprae]OAR21025.1 hypothetical protein A8144_08020 [Mycobacterium leprae 3125609]OAX71197.1 hypothetical protein A3216_07245 [Mycobacterium leprae 7935681]